MKLATFIAELLTDSDGYYVTEVDGADFEGKALKLGIMVEGTATEEDHGGEFGIEVGDTINRWSPEFQKLLDEEAK